MKETLTSNPRDRLKDIVARISGKSHLLTAYSPHIAYELETLLEEIDRLRARLRNRVNLCVCTYGTTQPAKCATCKADEESLAGAAVETSVVRASPEEEAAIKEAVREGRITFPGCRHLAPDEEGTTLVYHGFVSGKIGDWRCTVCKQTGQTWLAENGEVSL